MKKRLKLFKTFTKVEFYEKNDEINQNIENLMTIALWEFFWSNIFDPLILRITGVCVLPPGVTMATVKRTLKIKLLFF